MANKCKECGCSCKRCINSDHDVQLHVEIENLKQRLLEKENHIVIMETHFLNEANKFPNGELVAVREELLTWQDKYRRLYEAHRRVQRVNQGLEDKLLKLVDVCETEKNTLTKDVATLSHKLAEANYAIKKLTEDNERYKNDVGLAIQFLQCKQSNFVAHKFDSLPPEVQSRVSSYMTPKKKSDDRKAVPNEVKSIKVPMPTFPPTAMVYSIPKSPNPERKVDADIESAASASVDVVSAAVVAKVLEERQRERALAKHCDTCTCSKSLKIVYDNTHHTVGTQTGDYKELSCLKCNDSLQVAMSGMKIVRSNELKIETVVPVYALENLESVPFAPNTNNVVKVQPNNFLADNKSKIDSRNSSPVNVSSQTSSKNHSIKINSCVVSNEHGDDKLLHHRLCDKSLSNYEFGATIEKADSEKNIDMISAKNNSIDNPKGPRYCSMRVQSGSRNILLDNAHNNIAPVLYTRTHRRHDDTAQTHDSTNTSVSDTDHRLNSMASETSAQNQQRVAEWIQSTLDIDASSPEHSRSELNRNGKLDKVKYAEMEENVKRFLFGESEFQKTVEIGKKKYENFRDGSDESTTVAKGSGSMETNI